jgi:hypothetical protein
MGANQCSILIIIILCSYCLAWGARRKVLQQREVHSFLRSLEQVELSLNTQALQQLLDSLQGSEEETQS